MSSPPTTRISAPHLALLALTNLRRSRVISDDGYNQIEEELDRAELALTPVVG